MRRKSIKKETIDTVKARMYSRLQCDSAGLEGQSELTGVEITPIIASTDIANEFQQAQQIESTQWTQKNLGNTATKNLLVGQQQYISTSTTDMPDGLTVAEGYALESQIQSDMEQAFSHDFDNVRIHTGESADEAAGRFHARAFTIGNHIFFKQGTYNPSDNEGRYLLGHELAHTIQQSGNLPEMDDISPCRDRGLEDEADRTAISALSGTAAEITGKAAGVQFDDGLLSRAYRTVSGWLGGEEEGEVEAEPGTEEYDIEVAGELLTGIEEVLGRPLTATAIAAMRGPAPEFARHMEEVRTSLTSINWTVSWIRRAWRIGENGEDLLEVARAFHAWSQCDAMEDPRGFAREGGRALAALGDLGESLTPATLGPVRAIFRWLSRCDSLFTDVLNTIDPDQIYQRSGQWREMSRGERSEIWTLQE